MLYWWLHSSIDGTFASMFQVSKLRTRSLRRAIQAWWCRRSWWQLLVWQVLCPEGAKSTEATSSQAAKEDHQQPIRPMQCQELPHYWFGEVSVRKSRLQEIGTSNVLPGSHPETKQTGPITELQNLLLQKVLLSSGRFGQWRRRWRDRNWKER